MGVRECQKCGDVLLLAAFYKNHRTCNACKRPGNRLKTANWRKNNPDRSRILDTQAQRLRRKRDPEKFKLLDRVRRYRKYGITKDDYLKMLEAQDGLCALCRKPPNKKGLALDHNHKTGKARSLLCDLCNTGLGLFTEDPALLRRAAEYLEQYSVPAER